VAVEGAAQGLGAVLADPAAGDETLQGRGGRHAVLHAVLDRGRCYQRQGVADDQAVLVHGVGQAIAGAEGDVAPAQADVLERAALDDVGDVGVALALAAIADGGGFAWRPSV
jgi:hypothetical protein